MSITPLLTGSQPFEHYLSQVTIPPGIASARMDLHVSGCTGAAYFDQVTFTAANPIEQTGYDGITHSMAVEATSATGRRGLSQFDSRGRLVRSSYAANATTAPIELVQSRSFDGAGRLARVDVPATSDSDLITARFTYTDAGRLTSVIDPRGHETTMSYDARGQLRYVTSPTGIVSESAYDALGRLSATFRPRAADAAPTTLTASAYDAAGRLTTSTVFADGGTDVALQTKTTYDKASRVTAVAISGDVTASASATYDAIGRVTAASADGPAGPLSTTTKYDANSNVVSGTWSWAGLSDAPSAVWAKTDQLLTSRALGRDWAYSFNSGGGLSSVAGTLSALAISTDEFERTALVRATATSAVGPVSIGAWELGYDSHDRISSITRTGALGAASETFTYDRADRLVSWNRGGSGVAYGYDADSDLVSRGADTFAANAEDQLVSSVISGVAHTYASDEFGRRVSDAVAGSVVASLGWDAAGRLDVFTTPQTSATYRYGADGARALKVVVSSGATTSVRTIWSGTHPLAETVTSSGGVESRRYAYGPGGIPLALEVTSISGVKKTYAYVTDALGSVVALTDAAGSIVASYAYDPWGAPTGLGGSDLALASSQPLRYRAYYLDVESGLYHLPARVYDPATARFLSVDPAPPAAGSPQSLNAYAYCEGDPVGAQDPSGAITTDEAEAWSHYYTRFKGDRKAAGHATRQLRRTVRSHWSLRRATRIVLYGKHAPRDKDWDWEREAFARADDIGTDAFVTAAVGGWDELNKGGATIDHLEYVGHSWEGGTRIDGYDMILDRSPRITSSTCVLLRTCYAGKASGLGPQMSKVLGCTVVANQFLVRNNYDGTCQAGGLLESQVPDNLVNQMDLLFTEGWRIFRP